jgi:hypothetical protein
VEQHGRFKVGLFEYLRHARLRHVVSAPIVYGMIFPLLVMDLVITIHQFSCFPLYGIPRVRRSDYFAFDRDSLAYLNLLERFNCSYCSYANGLAAYVKQIIGLTEQYWCPIKHVRRILGAHSRYKWFVEFGDAEEYRKELERLRRDLGLAKE